MHFNCFTFRVMTDMFDLFFFIVSLLFILHCSFWFTFFLLLLILLIIIHLNYFIVNINVLCTFAYILDSPPASKPVIIYVLALILSTIYLFTLVCYINHFLFFIKCCGSLFVCLHLIIQVVQQVYALL